MNETLAVANQSTRRLYVLPVVATFRTFAAAHPSFFPNRNESRVFRFHPDFLKLLSGNAQKSRVVFNQSIRAHRQNRKNGIRRHAAEGDM